MFAMSDEGKNFIVMKFGQKGPQYVERMNQEMDELRIDALNVMHKIRNERACKELI